MIKVKDFAEQYNISTSQVKKLIATGHIKAVAMQEIVISNWRDA